MFFDQHNSTHLTIIEDNPSYKTILMDYDKRTKLFTLKAHKSFPGTHGEWGKFCLINHTAFFTSIKKWLAEEKCNPSSCALLVREPYITNNTQTEVPLFQKENLYASVPLLFQMALLGIKYNLCFKTISNIDYAYTYALTHSQHPYSSTTKKRLFVHNTLLDAFSTEDTEKEIIAAHGSYHIGNI